MSVKLRTRLHIVRYTIWLRILYEMSILKAAQENLNSFEPHGLLEKVIIKPFLCMKGSKKWIDKIVKKSYQKVCRVGITTTQNSEEDMSILSQFKNV